MSFKSRLVPETLSGVLWFTYMLRALIFQKSRLVLVPDVLGFTYMLLAGEQAKLGFSLATAIFT